MSLFVSKESRDKYAKYKDAKARQTAATTRRPAAAAANPASPGRTVPKPVEPLAENIVESDVHQAIDRTQAVLSGDAPPDIPVSAPPSKRKAAELARVASSGTGKGNANQAASLVRKLPEGQAAAPRAHVHRDANRPAHPDRDQAAHAGTRGADPPRRRGAPGEVTDSRRSARGAARPPDRAGATHLPPPAAPEEAPELRPRSLRP